jgi:hypothetical protein
MVKMYQSTWLECTSLHGENGQNVPVYMVKEGKTPTKAFHYHSLKCVTHKTERVTMITIEAQVVKTPNKVGDLCEQNLQLYRRKIAFQSLILYHSYHAGLCDL